MHRTNVTCLLAWMIFALCMLKITATQALAGVPLDERAIGEGGCACESNASALLRGYTKLTSHVSPHTGNFFIGYTDIAVAVPSDLDLRRAYNSTSPFVGMFGRGWGSPHEVYLRVLPDATVVVHEYGGGSGVHFRPAASVDDKTDADLSEMPVGTRFVSHESDFQYLQRTDTGFARHKHNDVELFDDSGRLRRRTDSEGNSLDFTYDDEGRLARISDNKGLSIELNRRHDGRVIKATLTGDFAGFLQRKGDELVEGSHSSHYRYDDEGRLAYARNAVGDEFHYVYSRDGRLIGMGTADATWAELEYTGADHDFAVASYRRPDGLLEEFSYRDAQSDEGLVRHVDVTRSRGGEVDALGSYEYHYRTTDDERPYVHEVIATVRGTMEAVTYDTRGKPLTIERSGRTARFEYDDRGRLTLQDTPYFTKTMEFGEFGKPTRVEETSKVVEGPTEWSAFAYDEVGRLTRIEGSNGRLILLEYDSRSNIRTMTSHDDDDVTKLTFEYDEICNRPSKITLAEVGSIDVEYDQQCSMSDVVSNGGAGVALRVSATFEQLLRLIEAAKISYTST